MTAPTPTPRLSWAVRPKHLACSHAGCGREPLMGFVSEDGSTFYGSCCYSDGLCELSGGRLRPPYFRTPEQRKHLLRGGG